MAKRLTILVAMTFATFVFTGCKPAFDSAEWKAERGVAAEVAHVRYDMVESLEAKHLKNGLPQKQVHQLLGVPDDDQTSLGAGWLGLTGQFDVYLLRSQRTIDIDLLYYVIEYDKAGNVIKFGTRMMPG